MLEFKNVEEYIDAFRRNSQLAVVSVQMAADYRGVTRAAIERMIATEQLEVIKIKSTRCIKLQGLIDLAEAFEHQVQIARKYLEEAAVAQTILFYEQVMQALGLSRTVPADRTKVGKVLGRVSEISFEKDGILLSAIVHRKTAGHTVPGPGFLTLAEELGLEWDDERTFADEHVKRVFDHYAKGSRRKRS
ncbi:hypothetical protein I6F33_27890 [Bradyrhizobium sp. BRP20]|uniref:hypothetical protein n=1 Tax=Bradyrhizobium sp. BRP20 TaxID=2793822 RepID=UPI001CD51232|nr:hypothetical protein [Bradyrhizobium sp. BRP20]MCA1436771.1 hypothetical protein [Bradyrhizobium sp. BRP20]